METRLIEIEQRCDLLQSHKLFPDITKRRLRRQVCCNRTQIAVEAYSTELQSRNEWCTSGFTARD